MDILCNLIYNMIAFCTISIVFVSTGKNNGKFTPHFNDKTKYIFYYKTLQKY